MGRQRKMKMEKDNRYIQKERENNMYTIDREIMKQVHKGKEINRKIRDKMKISRQRKRDKR